MTSARRARRAKLSSLIIGATAVSVLAASGWTAPARADVPVSAVGWWTNAPIKPSPPKGGVAVSLDPSGSRSDAAIRVNTGSAGVSRALLKLTEAGGEGQQVATVEACPADNSWTPVSGGNLSDAPKASCATHVQLTRNANGVWQADIYPLLSGKKGSVSIAILPGTPPSGLPTGVFQLDFQPPVVQGEIIATSAASPAAAPAAAAPQPSPAASTASPPAAAASANTSALPTGSAAAVGSELPAQAPPPVQAPSLSPSASSQATNSAEAANAANTGTDFTAHFPAATSGSDKRAVSTATVVFWLVMALVIGSIAGGLHWARAEKMLPSLPWRRRANLFERPL